MSQASEFDLGSLIWVKGEIDQALERARQSLMRHAETGDTAELRYAQTHLHQVRGAIEMVGLDGAARVAEALELAVGLAERGEADAAEISAAVRDATTQLGQFLESLVSGGENVPLKLLPAYRRVRTAQGEAATSGADLFFPDLIGQLPAGLTQVEMAPEALATFLKNTRARFEAGLLKWLKGTRAEGAQWMAQALLGVARSQSSALQRGFWWAAAALCEGLADHNAATDLDLRQVLARLNVQLKRLGEGYGKVAERLFRDVLYLVATLQTRSPHCAGVRRAFSLGRLLPSVPLESDAERLSQKQLARELRELLQQAKDNWARASAGAADRLPVLLDQLDPILQRATGLGLQGLPPLLTAIQQAVSHATPPVPEPEAVEVATAFLLVENALQLFPERAPDFDAQAAAMVERLRSGERAAPAVTLLDEVSRRAQERMLLTQVAQEIQANLRHIEQVLDTFFRDVNTRHELSGLNAPIAQVRGALMMLDEQAAQTLVDACAVVIEKLQEADYQAPAAELEFLADVLSAVGFYIDALQRDEAQRSEILRPALRKLLGDAADTLLTTPAPETSSISENNAGLETETAHAPIAHEATPAATIGTADAPAIEAVAPVGIASAPQAAAQAPVSDEAIDAELLEVYLEEAVEVLANVAEYTTRVRAEPSNRDALTVIRRGFHTLKGSGRMVGLNQLGEVAWAVEQVLNKWLQDEKPATDLLFELIDRAHDGFVRWVDELKTTQTAQVEASALFVLAEQLKSGQVPAPAPSPAAVITPDAAVVEAAEAAAQSDEKTAKTVEPPASLEVVSVKAAQPDADPIQSETPVLDVEIVASPHEEDVGGDLQIGAVTISRALFGIFLDEAHRHFATLSAAMMAARLDPAQPGPVHAAHTLCGIANTTGFHALGELGHAVEQVLLAYRQTNELPADDDHALLAHAVDCIGRMVGEVSQHIEPSEDPQTVAMLHLLAARLRNARTAETIDAEAEPTSAIEMPHSVAQDDNGLAVDVSEGDTPLAMRVDEAALEALLDVSETPEHADLDVLDLDLALEMPTDAASPAAAEEKADTIETAPAPVAAGESVDLTLDEAPSFDGIVEAPNVPAVAETHHTADSDASLDLVLEVPAVTAAEGVPENTAVAVHDVVEPTPEPDLALELDLPVVEEMAVEADALSAQASHDSLHDKERATATAEEVRIDLGGTPDDAPPMVLADVTSELTETLPATALGAPIEAERVVSFGMDETLLDAVPAEPVAAMPIDEPMAAVEERVPTLAEADSVGQTAPLRPTEARLAEIVVADELDEQLLPIFIEEAQELMPQISASLRQLRDAPTDTAPVDVLRRLLHTLKGSARMAGAMRLGEATHNMETRLLNASESAIHEVIEALEGDFDLVTELHDRLVRGEPATPVVTEGPAQEASAALAAAPQHTGVAQPISLVDPEVGRASIRVRADLIDRLVNQAGEVAIARSRIEAEMQALKRSLLDLTDNVGRLRSQLREIEIQAESQMASRLAHVSDAPDFDPLEFDRFTRLQELTRFMAESVNDVATIQHNLLKNLDESAAALTQQGRMTKDLQQELMRVRMVPFGSVSDRLYRLVRQTGKETGKKVNLELRGARVEIDRSVLEKMVSPFEHMLRNAIDHGLETPEARLAAGKPEFGEVLVEARQEGNDLVLTLRDDGAGLNLDRIREKAIERGLIQPGGDYTPSKLAHLIFEAGFSTAQQVTQLSGRGIGMDVVKSEIESLGGRVDVSSEAGRGTTFVIHLPLTLAVTQTVLVKVGEKHYAIPSVMVEQVQELKQDALEKVYQARQVHWLGNDYPFYYLPRLLGDVDTQPEQKRYNTVLLLRSGMQRIALHVDSLTKNQEVVVKNIGPQLVRVAGVAGATVLGNGEIVLILNPLALVQRRAEAPKADFERAASAVREEITLQQAPVVMVVDDSLTVRKITGRLLAREGYQVETAKDGVDALQQLQDIRPAVMLLDVEMPRMDGFELTRNIRANAALKDIPIIMITSRTADKHRNYALDLGVNVFLGKPYQEDELLEHIRRFTGEDVPA